MAVRGQRHYRFGAGQKAITGLAARHQPQTFASSVRGVDGNGHTTGEMGPRFDRCGGGSEMGGEKETNRGGG